MEFLLAGILGWVLFSVYGRRRVEEHAPIHLEHFDFEAAKSKE